MSDYLFHRNQQVDYELEAAKMLDEKRKDRMQFSESLPQGMSVGEDGMLAVQPEVMLPNTEDGEGIDYMGVANAIGDWALRLPNNVAGAAIEAGDQAIRFAIGEQNQAEASQWFSETFPEVTSALGSVKEWTETGDEITQELLQFALPFGAYLKGLKAAGMATPYAVVGAEAATMGINFDPHYERVANVASMLGVDAPMIEWLADKEGSDGLNRFKNALDSLLATGAVGSTFVAAKVLKDVVTKIPVPAAATATGVGAGAALTSEDAEAGIAGAIAKSMGNSGAIKRFANTTGDKAIDESVTQVVTMPPEEYLKQAFQATEGSLGGSYESWMASNSKDVGVAQEYAEKMNSGEQFPMPYIDLDKGAQDGRNRAIAAKKAGLDEIPVAIVDEPPVEERIGRIESQLSDAKGYRKYRLENQLAKLKSEATKVAGKQGLEITAQNAERLKQADIENAAKSEILQRVKDMGFDADNVYYHGTDQKFSEFRGDKVSWVSERPSLAADYAIYRGNISGNDPTIRQLRIKKGNVFDLDTIDREGSVGSLFVALTKGRDIPDKVKAQLKENMKIIEKGALEEESGPSYQRHDFVQNAGELFGKKGAKALTDSFDLMGIDTFKLTEQGVPTYGLRSNVNLRDIDAAFDPAKKDSPNLLAGGAGAAVATQAANGDNKPKKNKDVK